MSTGCFAKPTPPNCGFFAPTVLHDDFSDHDRTCFFYEDKGWDTSFPRWRVCFYYESHKAFTKFFPTERSKVEFLAALPSPE